VKSRTTPDNTNIMGIKKMVQGQANGASMQSMRDVQMMRQRNGWKRQNEKRRSERYCDEHTKESQKLVLKCPLRHEKRLSTPESSSVDLSATEISSVWSDPSLYQRGRKWFWCYSNKERPAQTSSMSGQICSA